MWVFHCPYPNQTLLGKNYRKSVGPFCHQNRLKNSIISQPPLSPTPIFFHYSNISVLEEEVQLLLDKGAVERKITPEVPGFYCRIFLVPKKPQEIKTHNRFVQTEHLCGCSGVQNGNSGKSQTGDSNQWLVFFPRSDRYLSSCTRAQSILEIPPILHLGSNIPIQSSSGLTTSPYVFTQLMTAIAIHLRKRAITVSISGRLVSKKSRVV